MKTKYSEKLRDPRWQKKRLEIFERDGFYCQQCGDGESTICVHHLRYIYGRDPWEYPNELLITLCEGCHEIEFECMKDSIDSLVEQIKDRGFLSGPVDTIARAFNGLIMGLPPEVMADIIKWALCDKDFVSDMIDRYFKHLRDMGEGSTKA